MSYSKRLQSFLTCVALLACNPATSSASSVTWEASGILYGVHDPDGLLPGIEKGTPWTLDITFNPQTPGVSSGNFCNTPTYAYNGAISATTFQLGAFHYTSSVASRINTNADLPYIGCGTGGLVQFELRGLIGADGGPELWPSDNLGHGSFLFLASYFDHQACDGSLPTTPGLPAALCVADFPQLAGMEFDRDGIGSGARAQFYSTFSPQAVPDTTPLLTLAPQIVPEPASLLLLGTGLVFGIRRRMKRAFYGAV